MSDILLSVGLQKGNIGTSQLELDIKEVVNRISKNPPKVSVGLKVDQSALNNFKSQLTQIVNSVSLSNGAPITVNISGLGEVSAQAQKAAEGLKKTKVSGAQLIDTLRQMEKLLNSNYGASTLKSYEKLRQQVVQFKQSILDANGNVKSAGDVLRMFGDNASSAIAEAKNAMAEFRAEMELTGESGTLSTKKFYSTIAQLKNIVTNTAGKEHFNSFKDMESALSDLSRVEQMVREQSVDLAYALRYSMVDGVATVKKAEDAMARFKAETSGAKVKVYDYAAQFKQVNTAIEQVQKNLNKWTKAQNGVSSSAYAELQSQLQKLIQLRDQLNQRATGFKGFESEFARISLAVQKASGEIKTAGENTQTFGDKIHALAAKFGSWLTVSQAIMQAIRAIKQMVNNVIELDSAMTELKKVTDATDATYSRFLKSAAARAKTIGASLSDVVTATADFARLGHSIDDASKLADVAIIYKNIGDGIEDITMASESIISTMQAFGIEASNAMSIVDKFNEVGNKYAISSAGIGEAMQRSAAAMASANNTIEETIALITAANTIVQNPESVGKNLPNSAVMRCKKTAISVKGRRRSRPRKDFVVCARRVRSSTSFCYAPEVITMAQKTGVYIQCEYCGKTVYKTLSQYKKRKQHFCSNKCQSLLKREITFEHRPCEVCGDDMYISKKSTKRFCSIECQHTWQLGNTGFNNRRFQGGYVKCESCGKEFLVGKSVLDSDRKHFCSASCRRTWYSTVWSQSDDWRLESRKRAINILTNNPATTQTKPQIAVNGMLDDMGIAYRNEEPYTYYAIDNYLPDFDLAVEVMGDYWHSSPLKYPNSVNDKQRHVISRDKAKHTYLKNFYDIEILYLWESDVLKRPEVCIELIRHYIECGGNLQNYHSFNYSIVDDRLELNDVIVRPYQERRIETAC